LVRIVLHGPESTGKTWLANLLAEHFNAPVVEEYLRTWVNLQNRLPNVSDIPEITFNRLKLESEISRKNPSLIICDTDEWTTCVYHTHYFNYLPEWLYDLAKGNDGLFLKKYQNEEWMKNPDFLWSSKTLYLLTDTDIPWESDPQREGEQFRNLIFPQFKSILLENNLLYETISGSWDERLNACIRAVNKFIHQ